MFTKPRSSVAGCEKKQSFVTTVSGCPLLLFIISFRLDATTTRSVDRRDSPIIYLPVDRDSNKQQQSCVLQSKARRRTGSCLTCAINMKSMFGILAVRVKEGARRCIFLRGTTENT